MSGNRKDWEVIGEPLGSGGQSTVYLVRGPARLDAKLQDIQRIFSFNPWGTSMADERMRRTGEFAEAVVDYGRTESPTELGALKEFKLRNDEQQAISRLQQEVEILSQDRPGLPKLLDYNVDERWMVTEYFPSETLEYNFSKYKGDVLRALKAFLSLARTVLELHTQNIIHRDIKPANVFVRQDDELVLGDFGIVFLPDQSPRLTKTSETVGPHDYMPPWAESNGRLVDVSVKVDVYMLGKLLWCMVSGRLRLQREWFDRPENDLTLLFRDDPAMSMVNVILKRCLVERPEQCQTSAGDLVLIVSAYISILERGGQMLHAGVPRPCHVCGHGQYHSYGYPSVQPAASQDGGLGLRLWVSDSTPTTLRVFPYVCDTCGHVEMFARPAPRLP